MRQFGNAKKCQALCGTIYLVALSKRQNPTHQKVIFIHLSIILVAKKPIDITVTKVFVKKCMSNKVNVKVRDSL